jgi:Tol biopolymer transport system component/cell wall-associated NlpC family hydrolase
MKSVQSVGRAQENPGYRLRASEHSNQAVLRRILTAVCLLLFVAGLSPGVSQRASAQTVNADLRLPDLPDGWLHGLSISADGRFAAFASPASSLVSGDANGMADIFVIDRDLGRLSLASKSSQGAASNGWSFDPVLSASGRFVAFASLASNLSASFGPADTNGLADVFLHDREFATTQRISLNPQAEELDGWSAQPSISFDGSRIAFTSSASNLLSGDANGEMDVYIRETLSGQVRRVSQSSSGEPGNGASFLPALSASGRFVAFLSTASNLDGENSAPGVYLHDLLTRQTRRLPLPSGAGNVHTAMRPAISADGGFVVFATRGLQGTLLYAYDHTQGATRQVGAVSFQNASSLFEVQAGISSDGRWLAYPSWDSGSTGRLAFVNLVDGRQTTLADIPVGSGSIAFSQVALGADAGTAVFILGRPGQTRPTAPGPAWAVETGRQSEERTMVSGWVSDGAGNPLPGITVTTRDGQRAVTDANGGYRFMALAQGVNRVKPELSGYQFSPNEYDILVGPGLAGAVETGNLSLAFTAWPQGVVDAARANIGMPYSLNRGCPSPFIPCGGPYSGFFSGDCTDLVLDAYRLGLDAGLQPILESDLVNHPRWYYQWRNLRSAQDMWRFFAYRGQVLDHAQAYLPGDIVFFDWEQDGRVDHVALVSDINERNRPTKLVDTTGVIVENPSGATIEFAWQPFHEASSVGHSRWSPAQTVRSPLGESLGGPAASSAQLMLLVALDSAEAQMRLRSGAQEWVTAGGSLPAGVRSASYGPSQVISVDSPASGDHWWTVEISSPVTTTFQMGIQLVQPGLVVDDSVTEGLVQPGAPRLYLFQLQPGSEGGVIIRLIEPEP